MFLSVLSLICLGSVVAEDANPCIGLPGGNGFVNDYSACDAYFSCVQGQPFRVNCPIPFHFNEAGMNCDTPENANCRRCPELGVTAVGDSTSCTSWVLCINGAEFPQECGPGTSFDSRIGRCNLSELVECTVDTCRQLANGGTGLAPSPSDCHEFFVCLDGNRLMTDRCSPGLAFDIVSNACNRLEVVTCFPGTSAWTIVPAAPIELLSHRKH